ncbi:MAG: PIN domain-containing protein [Planctomycetota bacterium]
MPRLAEFPSGGSVFLDANTLVYHFVNVHPSCTYTLHRSEIGDITALTSVPVVAETRHRLMVLEARERFSLSPRKVLAYLKRHPEQVKVLRACVEAVESLSLLRIKVVSPSLDTVLASQRIGSEYGLLTNDALLIAVMREHHLTHLASNDTDFLPVPDITLWRP